MERLKRDIVMTRKGAGQMYAVTKYRPELTMYGAPAHASTLFFKCRFELYGFSLSKRTARMEQMVNTQVESLEEVLNQMMRMAQASLGSGGIWGRLP